MQKQYEEAAFPQDVGSPSHMPSRGRRLLHAARCYLQNLLERDLDMPDQAGELLRNSYNWLQLHDAWAEEEDAEEALSNQDYNELSNLLDQYVCIQHEKRWQDIRSGRTRLQQQQQGLQAGTLNCNAAQGTAASSAKATATAAAGAGHSSSSACSGDSSPHTATAAAGRRPTQQNGAVGTSQQQSGIQTQQQQQQQPPLDHTDDTQHNSPDTPLALQISSPSAAINTATQPSPAAAAALPRQGSNRVFAASAAAVHGSGIGDEKTDRKRTAAPDNDGAAVHPLTAAGSSPSKKAKPAIQSVLLPDTPESRSGNARVTRYSSDTPGTQQQKQQQQCSLAPAQVDKRQVQLTRVAVGVDKAVAAAGVRFLMKQRQLAAAKARAAAAAAKLAASRGIALEAIYNTVSKTKKPDEPPCSMPVAPAPGSPRPAAAAAAVAPCQAPGGHTSPCSLEAGAQPAANEPGSGLKQPGQESTPWSMTAAPAAAAHAAEGSVQPAAAAAAPGGGCKTITRWDSSSSSWTRVSGEVGRQQGRDTSPSQQQQQSQQQEQQKIPQQQGKSPQQQQPTQQQKQPQSSQQQQEQSPQQQQLSQQQQQQSQQQLSLQQQQQQQQQQHWVSQWPCQQQHDPSWYQQQQYGYGWYQQQSDYAVMYQQQQYGQAWYQQPYDYQQQHVMYQQQQYDHGWYQQQQQQCYYTWHQQQCDQQQQQLNGTVAHPCTDDAAHKIAHNSGCNINAESDRQQQQQQPPASEPATAANNLNIQQQQLPRQNAQQPQTMRDANAATGQPQSATVFELPQQPSLPQQQKVDGSADPLSAAVIGRNVDADKEPYDARQACDCDVNAQVEQDSTAALHQLPAKAELQQAQQQQQGNDSADQLADPLLLCQAGGMSAEGCTGSLPAAAKHQAQIAAAGIQLPLSQATQMQQSTSEAAAAVGSGSDAGQPGDQSSSSHSLQQLSSASELQAAQVMIDWLFHHCRSSGFADKLLLKYVCAKIPETSMSAAAAVRNQLLVASIIINSSNTATDDDITQYEDGQKCLRPIVWRIPDDVLAVPRPLTAVAAAAEELGLLSCDSYTQSELMWRCCRDLINILDKQSAAGLMMKQVRMILSSRGFSKELSRQAECMCIDVLQLIQSTQRREDTAAAAAGPSCPKRVVDSNTHWKLMHPTESAAAAAMTSSSLAAKETATNELVQGGLSCLKSKHQSAAECRTKAPLSSRQVLRKAQSALLYLAAAWPLGLHQGNMLELLLQPDSAQQQHTAAKAAAVLLGLVDADLITDIHIRSVSGQLKRIFLVLQCEGLSHWMQPATPALQAKPPAAFHTSQQQQQQQHTDIINAIHLLFKHVDEVSRLLQMQAHAGLQLEALQVFMSSTADMSADVVETVVKVCKRLGVLTENADACLVYVG